MSSFFCCLTSPPCLFSNIFLLFFWEFFISVISSFFPLVSTLHSFCLFQFVFLSVYFKSTFFLFASTLQSFCSFQIVFFCLFPLNFLSVSFNSSYFLFVWTELFFCLFKLFTLWVGCRSCFVLFSSKEDTSITCCSSSRMEMKIALRKTLKRRKTWNPSKINLPIWSTVAVKTNRNSNSTSSFIVIY